MDAKDVATIARAERRLIDETELAILLGVTERYAKEMDRSGRIPGGVRIGSRRRWDLQILGPWIDQGCPALRDFDAGRADQ